MRVPLDKSITELADIPYTISYIIRKRQQIDNLNELPKEKRPTESIIWDGTPEEMEDWLDKVFDSKKQSNISDVLLSVKKGEIEGA